MKSKKKYPECEKIALNQTELRTLRNFLSWLEEKECAIINWNDGTYPLESPEDMFAAFLGIDNAKAEKERQQMIEELRSKNSSNISAMK